MFENKEISDDMRLWVVQCCHNECIPRPQPTFEFLCHYYLTFVLVCSADAAVHILTYLVNFVVSYSSLHVMFKLQRHMGYFLLQVYVPSVLLVAMSWVTFWLNREATSDRVGLGESVIYTCNSNILDIIQYLLWPFVSMSHITFLQTREPKQDASCPLVNVLQTTPKLTEKICWLNKANAILTIGL